MVKRFFAVSMIFMLLAQAHMQARAAVAAAAFNGIVNKTIADTVTKAAIRRGFAVNDPVFANTLAQLGASATTTMNVATGLSVVATIAGAPVWATTALTLGAAGLVAWGAYQMYQETVTDPATGNQVQAIKLVNAASLSSDPKPALTGLNATEAAKSTSKSGLITTTTVTTSTGTTTQPVFYRSPTMCADSLCFSLPPLPSSARYYRYMDQGRALPVHDVGDLIYASRYGVCPEGHTGCTYEPVTAAVVSATSLSVRVRYTDTRTGVWNESDQTAKANPDFKPTHVYGRDIGEALELLPSTYAGVRIDKATVANIANGLWQKAAQEPGYDGIPWSATDPVTTADVSSAVDGDLSKLPSLSDILAPLKGADQSAVVISPDLATVTAATPATSTSTGTSSGTQSGTGGITDVNVVNRPTVDIGNTVRVDLGTAPSVPLPTLEAAPTAASILDPIFGLLPGLRSYVVPEHAGVCPTGQLTLFGGTQMLEAHCQILEDVRPIVAALMAFAWAFVSVRITLSA